MGCVQMPPPDPPVRALEYPKIMEEDLAECFGGHAEIRLRPSNGSRRFDVDDRSRESGNAGSLARLQQFDLLSNRAATTIRAARAAWHYIFGFGGGSGGRGVADGRRERDTGRAQGQAGGGARGGADEKAFAVVFDLGLGQGIQIGDDLRP